MCCPGTATFTQKKEQLHAAQGEMISKSAAQECLKTLSAVLKKQERIRAAKQNRKEKESDILTSCSNAAVQGQRFSKMYVRWIS